MRRLLARLRAGLTGRSPAGGRGRHRGVVALTSALGTMVVVLPAFWSVGQLGRWWAVPSLTAVLAVMLALSLPRALAAVRPADWPVTALGLGLATLVAVVAIVAVGAGGYWAVAGAALFAVLAAVTVWLRRFGSAWQAVGLVAALPLIAALVVPLPAALSWSWLAWALIAALIAALWAYALAFLGSVGAGPGADGGGGAGGVSQARAARRGARDGHDVDRAAADGRRPGLRPRASTRLALQLGLAVGLAFGAAQLIQLDHLVWPVLTALLVQSNNRGRGDVLWKGAQRLVGALVGTALATLLVGLWPAGDARAVVAVFVVIALAAGLRPFGYVYWAACVTAGLAFFYGYLGQGGLDRLGQRLLGIVIGGAIAVAAAVFVLPVRTTDVVKSRLAALGQAMRDLTHLRQSGEASGAAVAAVVEARQEVVKLRPTLRAAAVFGIGSVRGLAGRVDQVLRQADGLLGGDSGG